MVEPLPTGVIHWSRGAIVASGQAVMPDETAFEGECNAQLRGQAHAAAVANLSQALAMVPVDAVRSAGDMFVGDDKMAARLAGMAQAAPVIDEVCQADGRLVLTIQMSLLGSFAQLMLPDDIKQVEPIRAMPRESGPEALRQPESGAEPKQTDPGVFSGLVVDARGIGARPAMVPTLMDESGRVVYGPPFISRSQAVHHGACLYLRVLEDRETHPRVAPRPLWVKGLHTPPERPSDIVISNADAARLHGASANLTFLRACRVIVLLD
ncbi:hypothetical protein [Desulfatitalea alkaliphila]|uniref:Uncharacterized protein n=1 Tax=Desulfatitalea alkaliphila TaxID=2929485 RepID=A0AA41UPB4_9BACT|nr:hypothetical protein [Desulfatitalea alkaliphila]MCJ8500323.1 hypothetical protein [Desulfatitalea alkaliphila]